MRKEDDNFHIFFKDKIIFPLYFLFVLNIL